MLVCARVIGELSVNACGIQNQCPAENRIQPQFAMRKEPVTHLRGQSLMRAWCWELNHGKVMLGVFFFHGKFDAHWVRRFASRPCLITRGYPQYTVLHRRLACFFPSMNFYLSWTWEIPFLCSKDYYIHTMWGPPVVSWFIKPINYSYKYHKP